MSDIMRPIPFGQLMNWILTEYRTQGTVFGVSKLVSRQNSPVLPIFHEKIESPFGPAAGPHTQMAQNIVAAYAAGARFFELKTVQVIDGEQLRQSVAKPCITVPDECYNCEWSTELTVEQAFDEYVKAWFALKLMAKELQLGRPDGFVFNMSVGYDLAGIRSGKINAFIEGMKDASSTQVFAECTRWALEHTALFCNVDEVDIRSIPSRISDSVTLSTLHGCPPDEIERIAVYLIQEKKLNTYIKCNPTLLGYDFARQRLNELGYDYIAFDDHHFRHDLQWEDAIPMFRRLSALCREQGVEFGLKLTNTFPVDVASGELPSSEMYMSGRSLFPLTIALARKISETFDGSLRISYSGGAEIRNIRALFDAGIWPITMATSILKPGGYDRMAQIAEIFADYDNKPFAGVDVAAVRQLDASAQEHLYQKPIKPLPNRKIGQKVPLMDCFTAPCRSGCPIGQDIPAYLAAVDAGRYEDALRIILERNPLPFITGTLCPHHCTDKCIRNHYDAHVDIRSAKLTAANAACSAVLPTLTPVSSGTGQKIAVIGGGPAGLAAAAFLCRAGADVTVFERSHALGGIVRHVIPDFRIGSAAIDADVALCSAFGAKFELNTEITSVQELKDRGYAHIIVSAGAWSPGVPGLRYGKAVDVIRFLHTAKTAPEMLHPGTDVIVIGGGNTAMDAARAAKRLPGVQSVRLVYRRTRRYMPADEEELAAALEDGVEFLERLSPIGIRNNRLECAVMELGAPASDGRRSVTETGETVSLPATMVIAAVGQRIDPTLFTGCGAALNKKGLPIVNEQLMTTAANVWAIGDCRRGPATVVEAIADAATVTTAITGFSFDWYDHANIRSDYTAVCSKKGIVCSDCDGSRCLDCATVCETCVSVCPNRANIAISVPGKRQRQILHIDALCNECGNCACFCPYDSRPYQDKFTLFGSAEDFESNQNSGYLPLPGSDILVRLGESVFRCNPGREDCGLPEDIRQLILAVAQRYSYLLDEGGAEPA